jgi:small subunit ribosomal protein S3
MLARVGRKEGVLGRKVHPSGFRLGIVTDWKSRWFAERNYTELLHEDFRLRGLIYKKLKGAAVSRIEIQRSANQAEITVHTAKPGIVIGRRGANVDALRKELEEATGKRIRLNIEEIRQPEMDAQLVAESIAEQLGKRVSYRRAMKQAATRTMRLGAQGVKIRCSGRLAGTEMARSVVEMRGRVPLHTIRADVDYAQVHAHTIYGRIGVKVWIYKGEILPEKTGPVQAGG